MSAREYLIEELRKIKLKFPDFNPAYEYDKSSSTFFIDVIPEELDNKDEFNEMCGMLIVDMMNKYPNEYLCFITSQSLTKLTNPKPVFSSFSVPIITLRPLSHNLIIRPPKTATQKQYEEYATPEFSGFCI